MKKALDKVFSSEPFIKHKKFFVYSAIGASGALLDLVLFLLFTKAFGMDPILANFISISCGIINNFFLNRAYNFRKHDRTLTRLAVFYAVGMFGIAISELFLFVLHNRVGIDAGVAKIISIPFVTVAQFLLNKTLSFSDDLSQTFNKKVLLLAAFLTAAFTIALLNSQYYFFPDEHDNIRSAQLITQGMLPYVDFFSHHMPLTYFIGVPLYLFAGTNVLLFKIGFMTVLFAWLLRMANSLNRYVNGKAALFFIAGMVIAQPLLWTHMLMAETLAAYAVCHATILLFLQIEKTKYVGIKQVWIVGLLGSIIALGTSAYIWLAFSVYVLLAGQFFRYYTWPTGASKKILSFLAHACVLTIPYAAFAAYIFLTKSLEAFIDQVYHFNVDYYSLFTHEATAGPLQGLLHQLRMSMTSLWASMSSIEGGSRFLIFAGCAALLISVYFLIRQRKYLLVSGIVTFAVLGGAREGFMRLFQDTRHGEIIGSLIILSVSITLGIIYAKKSTSQTVNTVKYVLLAFFVTPLVVAATAASLTHFDGYLTKQHTINIGVPYPARVINAVESKDDYYWVGPIDFYSQLFIDAKNASSYGFFLPWHGACPQCSTDFITDLSRNKPKVILFDSSIPVFSLTPPNYAPQVLELLEKNYYQIPNRPELQAFYFLREDKQQIDNALITNGIWDGRQ